MKVLTWQNCYRDNWNGLIVPEAYTHPAKFAPGLIRRIYQHCLEQGYLRKGDTVADPFGGIGGGGIMAAPMGIKWVGCELEQKFVDLALHNFALHAHAWQTMGYPMPVIVQGDSRHLSDVLGQADCCVTSPPHGDTNPAQSSSGINIEKQWETYRAQGGGMSLGKFRKQQEKHSGGYGSSEGQIGCMKSGSVEAVITSPPYAETIQSGAPGIDWDKAGRPDRTKSSKNRHHPMSTDEYVYSPNPHNIGNLRAGDVAAVVTSPPFSEPGSQPVGNCPSKPVRSKLKAMGIDNPQPYGFTKGQIGQEVAESYWQAVADVYRECFKILKPGGVMCVVLKAYIKQGRRVPLPMQTLKLLIHLGFTPLERIKAMLVEETITPGLFGNITKKTERKSFFRRLAEKKGSPEINWEEVLVVRKP